MAGALSIGLAADALPTAASPLTWETVVNNGFAIPESTRLFNSYSPPSVNDDAFVVFRAPTRGGQQAGEPITGVFSRDMATLGPVGVIVERNQLVPQPNNTGATFNEFPAFARIDRSSLLAATHGQSQPVWQVIDPTTGETVTRVGTAGIYATPGGGAAVTGMSNLPVIAGFPQFLVPSEAAGGAAGVRFDQFPGSPAAFDGGLIAFKGNSTVDGAGQTGVSCRDVTGTGAPVAVAWSGQAIPNAPWAVFGSTAPPSAAAGQIVFTGLDNEEAPTAGGIYLARVGQPGITTLVGIGETVPGVTTPSGTTLNRIGEALSFDGRRVAFWGGVGNRDPHRHPHLRKRGQRGCHRRLHRPVGWRVGHDDARGAAAPRDLRQGRGDGRAHAGRRDRRRVPGLPVLDLLRPAAGNGRGRRRGRGRAAAVARLRLHRAGRRSRRVQGAEDAGRG